VNVFSTSIRLNKIKALAKKPLNGGRPASEKNININETDQVLLILNKPDKFEMKKGCSSIRLNKFVCFWLK